MYHGPSSSKPIANEHQVSNEHTKTITAHIKPHKKMKFSGILIAVCNRIQQIEIMGKVTLPNDESFQVEEERARAKGEPRRQPICPVHIKY